MASQGIRIMDDISTLPEIEVATDIGTSIDVGDIGALDMGLLVNQKKLNSPPRVSQPSQAPSVSFSSSVNEVKADEIEFVNLEETTTSFSLNPSQTTNEPIRLVRDNSPPEPARPFGTSAPSTSQPAVQMPPPTTKSWFSSTPASAPEPEQKSGGIGQTFRNWFGGGSSSEDTSASQVPARTMEYLTPEQEFAKKTEQLTLLERMEKRGIMGNKMTMANTLDEITAEVERRKDSKALEASIRFQRSMLTTVTNGMEFLNNRFDPFGVHLDGWSEQVNENIEDYDEIFEELYDKYKDKSKVAPEVRLIMSLGLSAAMCHVTNTMFKSKMPGMDDILRNNPDLARQFAQAAAGQAVGPGFANFVGMGMSDRASRQAPPPSPPMGGFGSMFGSMGMPPPPPAQPQVSTARREMRGPSGVEDILQKLNQAGQEMPDRSVPPPASPQIDAEEVHSVRSGFTTETARLAGRSRRKTNTTQPVGATLTLNV
jgi:hypothetical protein